MLRKSKQFLIYSPLILLIGFLIYGFYSMLYNSNIYNNFSKIIIEQEYLNSFFYSIYISSITTSISLFFTLLLSYLLFILKFEYKKDISIWILFLQLPIFIPYALSAFLFFLILFPHFVGGSFAIVVAYLYKTVPFLLLLLLPYLFNIKKDEINLHKMYSDKKFIFFWNIIIQRGLKSLFIGAFIVFFYIINAYEIPYILGSYLDKMPSILVHEKFLEFGLNTVEESYSLSFVFMFLSICFIPLFWISFKIFKRVAF